VAVLCPQDELTGIGERGALREALARLFHNGYLKILLNLANVSEIDVSRMEVLSAAERGVVDDDNHQFEAETLEASCPQCVFDRLYNGRSGSDQESVSVKWGRRW